MEHELFKEVYDTQDDNMIIVNGLIKKAHVASLYL